MLYMQRSGSQDISLLSQPTVIEEIVKRGGKVRTTEKGRKGVLCEELNGAGALHSDRVSMEDRVIQPNEMLQHTSSQSEGWLSAPVLKDYNTQYGMRRANTRKNKKVEKNKKNRVNEDQK